MRGHDGWRPILATPTPEAAREQLDHMGPSSYPRRIVQVLHLEEPPDGVRRSEK